MGNWMPSTVAALALALPCFALAQQPAAANKAPTAPSSSAAPRSALAGMLEEKVRAAWAAFKNKDKDGYANFLADDFQAVEADGEGERTRLQVLREVEHCMYIDYLLQFLQAKSIAEKIS